jgi:WD40 repeat protein
MDSNTQRQHSENNNQVWERLPINSNYVDQIAISPDGKILASLHNRSIECLKIWDLVSGELLYAANWVELLKIAGVELEDLETSMYIASEVYPTILLYFNPDGNTLVCNSYGMGLIYDLEQGKVVRGKSVQSPFDPSYFGLPENIFVSPDLQIAATTHYGYTNLWEINTGRKIHTLSVDVEEERYPYISQYMSQFSSDGKIFASLIWFKDEFRGRRGKETIKVWKVEAGIEICSIPLSEDIRPGEQYTSVIALSSDGRILASNSGDQDKTVIVLSETLTGKEICRFPEFGWKDFVAKKLAEEESIGLKKFISSAFDKFLLIFSPKLSEMEINKQVLKSLELDREFRSIKPKTVVSLAFSPNDQIAVWQQKKDLA